MKRKKQKSKKKKQLTPIRVLDNWKLYQLSDKEFLVEDPYGNVEWFSTKTNAERHMLYGFYKELERPTVYKKKTVTKKRKKISLKKGYMDFERLKQMVILESEKDFRFLWDKVNKTYMVFVGRFNASFYAKSYQAAQRHYARLLSL